MCPRICLSHPGFLLEGRTVSHRILRWSFVFLLSLFQWCLISCQFHLSRSFLSSFLLIRLANGVSIFFIFSQKQLLLSFLFSIVHFCSISFISAQVFIIYLLLALFLCVCDFHPPPNSLRYDVSLSFCHHPIFFLFTLIAMYFPLMPACTRYHLFPWILCFQS